MVEKRSRGNANKMARWLIIAAAVLVTLGVAGAIYNIKVVNARVVEKIKNEPNGERAGIVALLTFAGGKAIPVNYLQKGNLVFMGADGPWWRNFPTTQEGGNGAPVELLIKGQTYQGLAKVELDDQAYIDEIFAELRPTVPEWLPDWLNGKLVVIELDLP